MIRRVAVATLLLVTSSGCARAPSPTASSPFVVGRDGETFEQESALRRAVYGLDGWRLTVDDRVRIVCPGARLAKHGLDWAETRGELRGSLVRVAECLREGALSTDAVTLVATTPSDDDAVPAARAEGIRDALVALGVDPSRVHVETEVGAPRDDGSPGACSVALHASASLAPMRHASK